MKKSPFLHHGLIVGCMALIVPALYAQTSIQLFGPVNVRASVNGTTYDAPNTFNSNTLNLTCPASPTAVLSSANGGNVLVDNNIQVSTSSPSVTGPTNVCTGGTSDSTDNGTSQNCFTSTYEGPAGNGQLTGQDPDSFSPSSGVTLANGGVPPIDIHTSLVQGSNQITISEVDGGGYLASSSLYLTTNCTQGGVTGGGSITGNPIPQTNPTPQQLTQNFTFNTGSGQQVQFVYDLSTAQAADTLAIQDGTIPGVEDAAVDPSTFQSVYGQNTPFSTSSCLIHTGELLPNGQPACKLFTLECTVGTDPAESGANCPISSAPNELFQDIFDGPSFSLQDISTPNGPTFHEGIGFLMASEPWNGGPCAFDPASGLENLPCPQNLLANFSGPGIYTSSSYTSHPNSTFIPVTGVPEPLTTVTVANLQAGNWVNTQTPNVTFSSQPPILSGLTEAQLPGVSTFAAAPIQSITYGTASVGNLPTPGVPGSVGTAITNPVSCPSTIPPGGTPPAFTPPAQPVALNADGNYLLYYFAQDCAGTQELDFVKDGTGSWSTSYYTVPINVDTVPPLVNSGPTLSPSTGSYIVGQPVTATYSCTDDRSGIVTCGASTFSADSAPLSTGPLNSPVDTSTPGNKTFTVMAVDAAGNKSSQSVSYVVTAYDSSIHVTLSQYTVTYPGGTNVVIQVSPTGGHTATGTVKLYDGTTLLQTSGLGGNGAAYLYIQGLNVGSHSLTASYSGDSNNAAGVSSPVILTVKPVPVQLSTSCWNANFPYGANYNCGVYTSSAAGAPQGVITYQYDGGATVTLPLSNGVANFIIPMPPAGNHTVVMGYAAQTNYAAANSSTQHFTVTKAPVILQLTPSTWYATGGNVTLSVAIQSWSAGPPNALGTVSFYNGKNLLATVPVTASGTAATTVTASSLGNGSKTLTASYSGSANYASGTTSVTITVAVK
ncbi:MAG TPA: Ig-like domain-containing protein [Acidobacteriaceae bacterium]|nr:Ig-like domain-containing protein [Acidobacteriaceae bacterium]